MKLARGIKRIGPAASPAGQHWAKWRVTLHIEWVCNCHYLSKCECSGPVLHEIEYRGSFNQAADWADAWQDKIESALSREWMVV